MRGKYYISIFILILLIGCIDPIAVDIQQEKKILVVEGYISTGPGPHRINLSKSAKFGDIFTGVIRPEEGADVWVRDNEGKVTLLSESNPGVYETPVGWKAILGNSYTLNVVTNVGVRYTSLAEKVIPVAPIDSLILNFKKFPSTDPNDFVSGVEVFARFKDPPETRDFYTWRNNGTFIIETHPELFTIRNVFQGTPVPAPKECCSICWVNELNADLSIKILDDDNTNGMENTQLAAFIPDNGVRLSDKYMAVIQQLSITKEAHAFFNLLNKQLSINGDIFDPPPATIRGNMINLDNPEENVIGYFYASDASIDTVFIDHDILEESQPIQQINDDCRVLPNSTTEKPSFWQF